VEAELVNVYQITDQVAEDVMYYVGYPATGLPLLGTDLATARKIGQQEFGDTIDNS
jgi:hypothetical protein